MRRTAFITGIVLLILSMGGACILFHKRPWKNAEQRTRFMLKMTTELVSPVPNHCIDDLHDKLKKHTSMSPDMIEAHFPRTAMGINPGDSVKGEVVLVQDSEVRACEDALRSCGNCHLPKKNNCDYQVFYEDEKSGKTTSVYGRVYKRQWNRLIMDQRDGLPVSIPVNRIKKSVWINGADPLHTWWDFKNFGKKGETAKRMLHIAATHGVACVNCHVRHGDFRLTKEGKEFKKTGRVIKRVPLNAFH